MEARLRHGAPASGPRASGERSEARLRAWKTQKPFEREELFAARLGVDALSEPDLLELLAEPDERLASRVGETPGWLAALRDAFSEPQDDGAQGAELLEGAPPDHPLAEFLPALTALLARGLTSLMDRVEALRERHGLAPITAGALTTAFVAELGPALLFQLSKPLVLELNIARLKGELEGENAEDRFADFARRLRDEDRLVALLRKYPVLARQLVTTVDQWGDYLGEILEHLCADWEVLCATFAGGADPGLLREVDAAKGDQHRGGRSVAVLTFDSGLKLVHKPKSLAVDVHFQELLGWLNERGAEPPLQPLKLLDRGAYGWSEFVGAAPCASPEAVSRFYERQGAYLALLYALNATDFHNENLIAAGEHPMLVDLEALLHPHVYGRDPLLAGNAAAGALDESVWQVGILPARVWADDDSVGVDTSALGGAAGQMNPHPVVGFDQPGRDEMRLGRRRVELPVSDNRPRLGDEPVDVLDHRAAIVGGFQRMYRLLCRHREAFLTQVLPRFAQDEIRVVVRSTNVYGVLLYESFHPDFLRDALDRDRFFDRLWLEAVQRPYLARVIPAERRELWRGDIPMFTTTPSSRTLFTSDGEAIPGFLDAASLDLARGRIERLSEDDLAKQTWIVEASLASLHMESGTPLARPRRSPLAAPGVGRERLLTMAEQVGDRLGELALESDGSAAWLGVAPLDAFNWGVAPSGTDLYAGATGVALFLAHLGEVTGRGAHTSLAQRALRSVHAQLGAWQESVADTPDGPRFQPIGAFEGVGSVVYGLTHLGVLWNASGLLDDAERLAGTVSQFIARDEQLDVIYGSAGCILALLGLHAIRPSAATLAGAVQCGERLLATAQKLPEGLAWTSLAGQPPLAGFSHGAAGYALSLLRLAARSGDDRFRQAGLAALAYERSLFLPELGNWADLRVFPAREGTSAGDDPDAKSMVAWCHGAAGIGLSRLAGLEHLDDAETRREIDAALTATVAFGFDSNHSLCHGALGNVELLLAAARALGRPHDQAALERATAQVVAGIEENGWITGVPLAVETPGLMTGLAGIGYELLRLADPDRVPSVLVLDLPRPPARG